METLETQVRPEDRARIDRIRNRYRDEVPRISVARARLYTEAWNRDLDSGLAVSVRVARAMGNVYEHAPLHLDPDDRIAGAWTEHFFGVPIDIERGIFNQVLEAELSKGAMIRHRGRNLARALWYLVRRGELGDFVRTQVAERRAGRAPLDMGLRTMDEREINAFEIADDDLNLLTRELLPWWKGRCLVDKLEDELASSGLYSEDMHDFVTAIPGNTSRQVMMVTTCATIACIQGHVILDYDRVARDGLVAMRLDLSQRLEAAETSADRDALRSQLISIEGVIRFSERLVEVIEREMLQSSDPARLQVLRTLRACCSRVPLAPASTFSEAIQAIWTVKTAVELAQPINLHCFGRLDQLLMPYYQADLDAGRIDPAGAQALLEELLLKIMAQNIRPESGMLSHFYHRFLGSSPVTVGGLTPEGDDATNALTHLFVRAAHGSRAVTNLSVRIHPDTPDELLHEIATSLADGTSSYSLFNDSIQVEAMRRRGFEESDARNYALMGCVEATVPGKTGSMSANALLLTRLLDLTLRNGDSRLLAGTIRDEGLRTGTADSFTSFEALESALLEQGRAAISKIVQASNIRDRVHSEQLPAPAISAFMDGCARTARDVTQGGATYDLSGISMINSIANLTDSLWVIKKLVFEQGRFSLAELLAAMDADYVGHEHVLSAIRALPGKWGNGDPECDRLAARVTQALFDETHRHTNFRGGPFVVYVISMITHTIDGRLSVASADGRRAGVPFAASCNPANVERAGVTGAMRSVAALPFEDVLGAAVNLRFHPSAVGLDRATREKWVALVRTYFAMGGAQLQPTCVSAEMLMEARKNPDNYRDLIVKVGGYSTYFTELGREIQQEIIERTEHGGGL